VQTGRISKLNSKLEFQLFFNDIRSSRITHHASRITHHASRITHHASRITHHASRPCYFVTLSLCHFVTRYSSRITHNCFLFSAFLRPFL